MTDKQTPPDWVLIEAANRSGWDVYHPEFLLRRYTSKHSDYGSYRALCDMIERYEQPPVDRKVLCAEEALRQWREGDGAPTTWIALRAIELYEGGFGK
jgi:hypothetical protein